ncbi:MAG: gliding motility-associated protein GldE [Parvicellaceae bacterium]
MEPPPYQLFYLSILQPFSLSLAISLLVMLILVFASALLSGTEVAIFSLTHSEKSQLIDEKENKKSQRVLILLEKPKKLLATILIANNLVNVSIVMVSTFVMDHLFLVNEMSEMSAFVIQVVLVTFIILLFGEVIPKVYANNYSIIFSRFMSLPISVLKKIFNPLSDLLISSTSIIDKKIEKKSEQFNAEELEHALDLTKDSVKNEDEKKILEGIVKFGQTDVKQIMTPRTDVISFENDINYKNLIQQLKSVNYSRIPVFEESFDNIKGVLYVKDLLGKIEEEADYKWVNLLREAKFVPENKKLDDLLKEFQEERKHIAIVVDEYGGSSGIVTLEDVLEEIVGEITDEFDEQDITFKKIDECNYMFDGKSALIDIYKILEIDGDNFESVKGEADTIAGFCIEQAGKIMLKNEKVNFDKYTFTVEAADKRRIKKVKITINEVSQ